MAGGIVTSSPTSKRGEHCPLLVTPTTLSLYETARGGEALARKYAVEAKPVASYQKMEATRRVTSTSYGTLMLNQDDDAHSTKMDKISPRDLAVGDHIADPLHGSNNQSETESDSDGSCGSSAAHPAPAIPSILRIRSTDTGCHTLEKKPSSVGFAIDISDTDDEDDEYEGDDDKTQRKQGQTRRLSCSSRCIPRRLTLEEKADLYRVRPDLELTPMPVLLRDVEEMRRRRQRKLVFTMLGGTLIILMMVVMYYVFSQV